MSAGQAEFIRVPGGTGRVYYFSFKDRAIPKAFFWFQEASTDKDEEYQRTIATALNTFAPPAPAVTAPTGAVQLSDLQQILNSLSSVVVPTAPAEEPQRGRSLQKVLTPSSLESLITQLPEGAEQLFAEHLPEHHRSRQDVIELVHSPQFRQALSQLNRLLRSEDVPSLFYQCELPWSDEILHMPPVEAFFRAIQRQADSKK